LSFHGIACEWYCAAYLTVGGALEATRPWGLIAVVVFIAGVARTTRF
jgi:hypothetical protein